MLVLYHLLCDTFDTKKIFCWMLFNIEYSTWLHVSIALNYRFANPLHGFYVMYVIFLQRKKKQIIMRIYYCTMALAIDHSCPVAVIAIIGLFVHLHAHQAIVFFKILTLDSSK